MRVRKRRPRRRRDTGAQSGCSLVMGSPGCTELCGRGPQPRFLHPGAATYVVGVFDLNTNKLLQLPRAILDAIIYDELHLVYVQASS
jgi:hypothetical protein